MVIRPARDSDAAFLPDIECSAGRAFLAMEALAWIADDEVAGVEWHRERIAQGATWVAVDAQDRPVGFLAAEAADGELHVRELSVRQEYQGRGLGRALLEAAIEAARRRGLSAVTLTTFRGVAWNEPFYRRLGFETVDGRRAGERLNAILRAEAAHGLPAELRCAMRLTVASGSARFAG